MNTLNYLISEKLLTFTYEKIKKKETLFSEHTDLALNKSLCIYNQTEKKTMKHFELLDERKLLQLIRKNQVQ